MGVTNTNIFLETSVPVRVCRLSWMTLKKKTKKIEYQKSKSSLNTAVLIYKVRMYGAMKSGKKQ